MKPAATDHVLRVEGLRKGFNGLPVLRGIDLAVPRGGLFTVLGPSGAGKSVFLKCLANVLQPDEGTIFFDGRPMGRGTDPGVRAEFRKRCSFLFQSNALLDSLTALENVALPSSRPPGSTMTRSATAAWKPSASWRCTSSPTTIRENSRAACRSASPSRARS